jgi:putative serine protease PepD
VDHPTDRLQPASGEDKPGHVAPPPHAPAARPPGWNGWGEQPAAQAPEGTGPPGRASGNAAPGGQDPWPAAPGRWPPAGPPLGVRQHEPWGAPQPSPPAAQGGWDAGAREPQAWAQPGATQPRGAQQPTGQLPSWLGEQAGPAQRRPTADPRRPGLLGAGILLGALLVGLLGGLLGSRIGGGRPAAAGRPVVNQVVASNKSATDRVEAVAQNLLPVTVQIQVGSGAADGTGSGVIMSANGYVITNNHVVQDADTITVVLPNSEALRAELVGADPSNDLAVVKVDRRGLPVANFGRSANLKVGELTVAVGSPFGLQGSVTSGVVSALHRVVQLGGDEQLVNAIQTDASINPGNSGGALANGAGQVIGINSAIATNGQTEANAGVGFAIPIDEALDVARALIAGKQIRTPRLGVRGGADLTPEIAERYDLKGRTGALIREVEPGSPAARAGMRPGDLVVRINGAEVNGWDELVVNVRKVDVGQTVPAVVVREGRELTLQITPTDSTP